MPTRIDPQSIRDYAARDWAGARARKRAYWAARLDAGGFHEALRVTGQLREWMMSTDAAWPSQSDRDEDFATHVRVAQALARTPSPRRSARARARRVR